ncbi:MAG: hypothetical protein BJ554DRAFT_2825 [Olpidium bornovanus]|uniref:Spermatogenesis-associated protein 17 n=1 Tax=Olpidium bornovanus TaxID=278681 RepID=A0A8H7ZQD9_9FUNG|nr:MAG: hypothetical protein BJ554DRAFT_2825 [Olpidium bornovanus]
MNFPLPWCCCAWRSPFKRGAPLAKREQNEKAPALSARCADLHVLSVKFARKATGFPSSVWAMAIAFAKIKANKGADFIDEYFVYLAAANQHREREYNACCVIQRTWHRYKTRGWMRYLLEAVITIQKHWRAYSAKKKAEQLVQKRSLARRMMVYNDMANRIQKIWRGYYSRKTRFDYHKRKASIERMRAKANEMRAELQEYQNRQQELRDRQKHQALAEKLERLANNRHHLISTKEIPGVLASGRCPPLRRDLPAKGRPRRDNEETGSWAELSLTEEQIRNAPEVKHGEESKAHRSQEKGRPGRRRRASGRFQKKSPGPFSGEGRWPNCTILAQPFCLRMLPACRLTDNARSCLAQMVAEVQVGTDHA